MDSDEHIQAFLNCTQKILGQYQLWENLNVTQILDALPEQLREDMSLNNCMGLGKRPYVPPWWGQLCWFIIFAVMLLLAVVGNTLVIWIVLVNLAVADLLMATLNGAPNFVFLVTAHWPFGSITCTASNFTANLTVSAGVFTLVAITVDRYVAIVKPLQHRLSRRMARTVLFTVWCASALLALPSLIYSDTYTKKYINDEREICFVKWPDGSYPTSRIDYSYNLVFLSVTYVVPMSVMVVRMFVLVVMVFALCWLPYHAYFILVYHHQSLASAPFAQHIYLAFYWLAMANSIFRIYFRLVLCWCRTVKSATPNDLKKQLDMQKSFSDSDRMYFCVINSIIKIEQFMFNLHEEREQYGI
ncbi:unnamed protein product, partial [Leptidea sinapis]